MTDLHPGARRASLDAIDRDGLVAFVQELVRVPSVNRPAEGLSEAPAAALVAERMRAFGWQPVVEEVAPGRPNVVCDVVGGLPGPTLLFEGHTDVVTEGDPSRWTHPPFDAVIEGGRLHGRGSADMKGGLGAMLFATAALASAGPFPGRIRLAALCDEEEMMIGVKHFVTAGWAADVDAAIVCEPEDGEVCTTQKGAIRLRVDAAGRMAHGAMPQHGRNPLTALARLQGRLESLQAELQARTGEHPHLGWPYVTPTVVSGGTLAQLNVIPADAFLGVDLRTVPGVDHPELIERVRAEAAAVAAETEVGLAVTVIDDRPPTDTDETHPVVQAVFDAHAAVTGETPRYGGVPGSTDGTILWRDGGLPVVVYGPGGKWIAHQVDEYVEVAQLVDAAGVYLLAADTFLRGGVAGR